MTGTVANKEHWIYYTPGLDSLTKYKTLSIYKRNSLHSQGQCVGNLKGLLSFLLLCCQAIRGRNREWDSPWVIPRFTLARSNFPVLNYELIAWPWSCLSEGAAPISSWQNVIFVSEGPDVNVPLQQPAKSSELSWSDPARCWQTLQMCCLLKMHPLHLWGGLDTFSQQTSVTVPAHQDVGLTLTSTKWITSGLGLGLGMFVKVFKIKSYIWKWDFNREKYSVSFIKNKGPDSSVHHSRIKLMNFRELYPDLSHHKPRAVEFFPIMCGE